MVNCKTTKVFSIRQQAKGPRLQIKREVVAERMNLMSKIHCALDKVMGQHSGGNPQKQNIVGEAILDILRTKFDRCSHGRICYA